MSNQFDIVEGRGLPLIAIALVLISGCTSAPRVTVESKPGVDLSRYRTFALMPLPKPPTTSDPGARVRLSDPARRAVVDGLTAKGYSEAPGGSASFSVNLRGQSLPKVEVTDLGFHYPVYTRYGQVNVVRNPSTSVNTYEERTLSIEVYDGKSKDEVWVGWLSQRGQAPVSDEALTNAIHNILLKFPSRTSPD